MRIGTLLAFVVLAGCSDSSDLIGPRSGRAPTDFVVSRTGSDAGVDSAAYPASVSVAPGHFEVVGVIVTGNPCQDISASVTRHERRIVLTIEARARPVACVTMLGSFTYRASEDVSPGSYDLQVVHRYDNGRAIDEVVVDTSIIVP